MSELSSTRLWAMRAGFVVLTLVVIFFHLLPLQTSPRSWAGPDVLLAFAFAWSVRRPEFVPIVLLAFAFLLADLLLQRPPGLWAVLALLACESLKSQASSLRDSSLFNELATVSSLIVGVCVGHRIIMAIFLLDLPPLSMAMMQMGLTVLIYPLAVFITHALMGVRKAIPGEFDGKGQSL